MRLSRRDRHRKSRPGGPPRKAGWEASDPRTPGHRVGRTRIRRLDCAPGFRSGHSGPRRLGPSRSGTCSVTRAPGRSGAPALALSSRLATWASQGTGDGSPRASRAHMLRASAYRALPRPVRSRRESTIGDQPAPRQAVPRDSPRANPHIAQTGKNRPQRPGSKCEVQPRWDRQETRHQEKWL